MEKIADIKPTEELSPKLIKTICDAISQAEGDDDGGTTLESYYTVRAIRKAVTEDST